MMTWAFGDWIKRAWKQWRCKHLYSWSLNDKWKCSECKDHD